MKPKSSGGLTNLNKMLGKSLFRSTLPASYRESILCMGPLKVFKTGNLRMIATLMQSILCRQSIHTKYFTGGGGGYYLWVSRRLKMSRRRDRKSVVLGQREG